MGYLRLLVFAFCGAMTLSSGCGDSAPTPDSGVVPEVRVCFEPDPWALERPEDAMPCLHNGECGEREYCYSPSCNGEGWCMARPESCVDVNFPECGCNGGSYSNFCYAAARGDRTAGCDQCPSCENNDDCADDQYCNGFGDCSGPGHCGVRPEHCPSTIEPVCGCNGVSYDNECLAWAAGVRVSARGSCECVTSDDCASGEYCTAESCNAPGTCESVSEACATGFGMPICGCDNVTYGTECAAARVGIRRDAFAACGTY
jgi:hypothetical protein